MYNIAKAYQIERSRYNTAQLFTQNTDRNKRREGGQGETAKTVPVAYGACCRTHPATRPTVATPAVQIWDQQHACGAYEYNDKHKQEHTAVDSTVHTPNVAPHKNAIHRVHPK